MIKGILFTLLACFFWGFTFVIPALLTNFSSIEIALGRYFIFGTLSVILFGLFSFRELTQYPIHFWLKALLFSLVGNIIYFASLVFAVKYSSPSITTLIVGIAPVTTAFYGNWKERECSFSKLVFPSLLIVLGLIIINVESLSQSETNLLNPHYLFGLLCACITLLSFTWYTISNASFLKKNQAVSFFEWTTMMGVTTLLLVILIVIPMIPFIELSHIEKYSVWTSEMQHFTLLISILGIFCSWLSTFLWSSGCVLLPVSLGGQMSIFKTVFGLLFVYMYEQRFPSFLEFLGIFMIFIAIYSTMNIFTKAKTNYATIN